MKNNKKLFMFGLSFVILTIFITILFFIISSIKQDNIKKINIYYYDKLNSNILPEYRKFDIKESSVVQDIFNELKSLTKNSNLKPIIPNDVQLIDYRIEGNTLIINLSKEYNNLSDIDKVIFKVGFLWTVTELDFIKNVKISVENKEIILNNNVMVLNRNNTILNPFISPHRIKQEKITLYFANNKNKLVKETIKTDFKQNKSMEIQIVEELINGSKSKKNVKVIPSETKIRNIKTEDGICYIDLNSEFINKMQGSEEQQKLAIYSIVNSLTELSHISKVQFLIDGEKVGKIKNIDISNPIGYNAKIVED